MMKWVFSGIIILSIIVGAATGNISEVSGAALESGADALELALYLAGGMCVWGGIMRVADKAGLSAAFCKIFAPIGRRIFIGIDCNGKAFRAISMNIAANILGLGNAATPLGLEAMRELEREEGESETASANMTALVVLNTASLTLMPTTVAMLRTKYGAEHPLDIYPCVLISSAVILLVAMTFVKLTVKRHE